MARYLGNKNTMELHDLYDEKPNCKINEIQQEHKVTFNPDAKETAKVQGYNYCAFCTGKSQSVARRYYIQTLSIDEFKEIILNGDDSVNNQIRVNEDGEIYLSQVVGGDDINGLRFRFETYDAGNSYVGKDAANDDKYILETYNDLMKCWNTGRRGYIDFV